ncbi:actin-like protein 9 [Pteropus alecto]|uniref:Actin-like protein 9 n=2 Tax=Pteropus TaxID=9401 RepID=A0A6P3RQI0_PTEVA|nr:actin-like protein 9 [Pteropus alecto]XP_011381255.1 actin-like protein 9 [Pteropus vampyrus]XP_039714365.1 actin-like protein 9 [Pteropus giganteus]ELK08109.1 Actin-like protein 9 [Pteropus alecto]
MDAYDSNFWLPQCRPEVPRPGLMPSSIQVNKTLQQDSPSMVGDRLLPKNSAVVIDMGTGTCKVGFAGQARPTYTVATIVGCQPKKPATSGQPVLETFIGEAARMRPELTLVQPVRNGITVDWDAAELIWRHMLEHDLRIATGDHPLLFSDPPFSPATNREKLVEVAFESLRSPAMYVASQSVLSVYAHGRVSGLVVDTGHGVTSTVPVFQGYHLPHATERLDLAGTHLTAFLAEMLLGSGLPLGQQDLDTVENIKHRYCYVAPDFQKEQARPEQEYRQSLKLPDGRTVTLGKELFQCPELLFSPPEMPGLSPVGVPIMAKQSLHKVPSEVRADVAQNVLLCGGSSLFVGFEGRFRAELLRSLPPEEHVVVAAQPTRNFSVWIGGSILASLRAFQSCWVLREQYEEQGPHIVYRRCY